MDVPAAKATAAAPPAEHEVDKKEVREAEVEVNLMQPPPRTKKGKKKKSGAGGIEERLDDFKSEVRQLQVPEKYAHFIFSWRSSRAAKSNSS